MMVDTIFILVVVAFLALCISVFVYGVLLLILILLLKITNWLFVKDFINISNQHEANTYKFILPQLQIRNSELREEWQKYDGFQVQKNGLIYSEIESKINHANWLIQSFASRIASWRKLNQTPNNQPSRELIEKFKEDISALANNFFLYLSLINCRKKIGAEHALISAKLSQLHCNLTLFQKECRNTLRKIDETRGVIKKEADLKIDISPWTRKLDFCIQEIQNILQSTRFGARPGLKKFESNFVTTLASYSVLKKDIEKTSAFRKHFTQRHTKISEETIFAQNNLRREGILGIYNDLIEWVTRESLRADAKMQVRDLNGANQYLQNAENWLSLIKILPEAQRATKSLSAINKTALNCRQIAHLISEINRCLKEAITVSENYKAGECAIYLSRLIKNSEIELAQHTKGSQNLTNIFEQTRSNLKSQHDRLQSTATFSSENLLNEYQILMRMCPDLHDPLAKLSNWSLKAENLSQRIYLETEYLQKTIHLINSSISYQFTKLVEYTQKSKEWFCLYKLYQSTEKDLNEADKKFSRIGEASTCAELRDTILNIQSNLNAVENGFKDLSECYSKLDNTVRELLFSRSILSTLSWQKNKGREQVVSSFLEELNNNISYAKHKTSLHETQENLEKISKQINEFIDGFLTRHERSSYEYASKGKKTV